MEQNAQKKSPMEQLRGMGYPIAMVAFIIIILGLFFGVARFLSTNIDSAITSPDQTQIQAQLTHINEEAYASVATKLHLPAIQSSTLETTTTPTVATSTEAAATPETPTTPTGESKSSFILAVFNSTKKSGVANTVKGDLTTAGFTVTKTGNKAPEEPQTLVQIKERVQASPTILEEVLSILGKRYTVGDPQILENTSPYDIVITIGAK